MATVEAPPEPPLRSALDLALRFALALHRAGSPSWRVEEGVEQLGQALGQPLGCFATPTGLQVFTPDQVRVRRVSPGDVDLAAQDQLQRALLTARRGELGALSAALDRLERRPPMGRLPATLALLAASAGAAALLGGGQATALAGALGGLLVALLDAARAPGLARLLPLLGAAGATAVAGLLGRALPVDAPIAVISAIILILPGFSLTVGVAEVASGHPSAGTARLGSALVTLLLLALGAAAGAPLLVPSGADLPLPGWATPVALAGTAAALGALFRAAPRHLPLVGVGVLLAWAASAHLPLPSAPARAFAAALLVGVAGNLVLRARLAPAQVLTVPGTLLLVPGALGFRALMALLRHDPDGVALLTDALAVAGALVGGLLTAGMLLPPRARPGGAVSPAPPWA